MTMAAAAFLASFAALYFWFPKMFGRMLDERLGKLHFWGTIIPLTIVFCTMFISGWAGMPRRYYDHTDSVYLRPLQHLNVLTSVAAFVLGATQLIFAFNFIKSRWWAPRPP